MKPSIESAVETACFHCGEPCADDYFRKEQKVFCCQGCQLVHELLQENELGQYYEFPDRAVPTLKGRIRQDYSWVDQPEIREKLLDYYDTSVCKVSFYLPQIHCSACLWLLEKLYKFHPGINSSRVHFLKKEIYLSYDPLQLSLRELVELLATIGYPPKLNLDKLEGEDKKPVSAKLIYQLGIAGFVFGNTMLLSFPEYLGLDAFLDEGFRQFFGYLNIFLAIPVLFYCGQDYLRSAWQAIRHGQLNIDIPISLGILTLFFRSVYEILSLTGAGYLDSLAGLIFFLLVGRWFQQKTYHHLSFERDYKSYFPVAAKLVNGTSVPLNQLKKGDRIVIHNGELIPADGWLDRGAARIDYGFVTGESEPQRREVGEKLFAGGRQVGARIELTVSKAVSQSYLTQLWNENAFGQKKHVTSLLHAQDIGRYFTIGVLLIALTTLAYWLPRDLPTAINAFTAVLIIACPCAIALTVPFTFGNALRLLGRTQLYLKNVVVIEHWQKITTVVFDKTGTLTPSNGKQLFSFVGTVPSQKAQHQIFALASQSTHPISRQIVIYWSGAAALMPVEKFREYPGLGLQARVGGQAVRIGKSDWVDPALGSIDGTFVKIDDQVLGHFIHHHQLRPGIGDLLRLLTTDYRLFLLSGDSDREKALVQSYFCASNMHFNQSPKDKLDFVKSLQARGEKVMMIGDGLNDAGALQQSDLGLVVSDNTNNFSPACDAILAAEQLPKLPGLIKFMRSCNALVYAAYGLAILYNILGLSYAVQGLLSPIIAAILMPLSSITIVVFGVVGSWWLYWRLLGGAQLSRHQNAEDANRH